MSDDIFRQTLETLNQEYRRELPGRIARIDELWGDIVRGGITPDRWTELVRALHTLSGSARTFGVEGVSEAAAAAEAFLEPLDGPGHFLDAAQISECSSLLSALRAAAGVDAVG